MSPESTSPEQLLIELLLILDEIAAEHPEAQS